VEAILPLRLRPLRAEAWLPFDRGLGLEIVDLDTPVFLFKSCSKRNKEDSPVPVEDPEPALGRFPPLDFFGLGVALRPLGFNFIIASRIGFDSCVEGSNSLSIVH
jgi:hypothetical protein